MDLEALVLALGSGNHRRVADKRVVNSGVRDQVGLELVEIDVESTVESEGRGDGADYLGDQAVQVLKGRSRNVKIPAADVVNGLIVDKESTIRVLNGAVSRQNGVVRLHNGSRDTRSRVDGKLQLRLLAILGREALEHESTETRAGTATERVED